MRQTRTEQQASIGVGDVHGLSPDAGGTAGGGGEATGDGRGVQGTGGLKGGAGATTHTRLFSRNADVDYLNQEQLAKLEGRRLLRLASALTPGQPRRAARDGGRHEA